MAKAESKPSLAKEIIALLTDSKQTIALAESCTGGLLSAALTGVPGASIAVYGGFVTYSNSAKTRLIGVPARLIRDYGAVSTQVARAMANGARTTAHTDVAVSVTGIAGPTGGSDEKPVGLVHIAVATEHDTTVREFRFGPVGRDEVRSLSVDAALALLLEVLSLPVEV
ncbi:MAG: CinA [Devosia sp.]|nr:CinA [Devosia sp.]